MYTVNIQNLIQLHLFTELSRNDFSSIPRTVGEALISTVLILYMYLADLSNISKSKIQFVSLEAKGSILLLF